jgi:uncharacterized protein YndB with AHSA1/START domain
MRKLTFSTTINAPKEKVWRVMLEDPTYRQWTTVFHEGSYAVTDWTVGSKALFLIPEGDGMVSRIEAHRPNEFLSIEHLGTVKKGVEDTTSKEAKSWAGVHENYTLKEVNDVSTLTVEMDTSDEFLKFFEDTWPKALKKLKEISEQNQLTGSELRRNAI